MIERQIDRPIPIPEDFVVTKASNILCALSGESPIPQSNHRHSHLMHCILLRSDNQLSLSICDRLHRFYTINDQI